MIQYLIFLTSLVALTLAQRPTYAGTSPKGYPDLASRFRDPNETSTSTQSVVNRVGEDGTTAKLPVDARGDGNLVDRLNTWPQEHRPFWLLNAEQIEKHRNQTPNPANSEQPLASRADFAGQGPTFVPTSQRAPFAGEAPRDGRLPVTDGAMASNKPSEATVNMITDRRTTIPDQTHLNERSTFLDEAPYQSKYNTQRRNFMGFWR